MRDLATDPCWQATDLGQPLPDSPHAVSVAIPLWEHVVGYEENDPAVTSQFRCGYPRFFLHPIVRCLFDAATAELADGDEAALVFPSEAGARRCLHYAGQGRTEPWWGDLTACVVPSSLMDRARMQWRLGGEVVSSRRAEVILNGASADEAAGVLARVTIAQRLAALSGQAPDDVHLFPSGMAAFSAAHRIVTRLHPGKKTIQFEFPYVDALKVQQEGGRGVVFVANPDDLTEVHAAIREGRLAAVFCEIASNPQLRTADLAGLSALLRPEGIPLVVDDTVSSVHNVDVYPYADLVTTSLTKWFSGAGDVMAGSLIVSRHSPLCDTLRHEALLEPADLLWCEDAVVLERNSRDFPHRMERINETADAIRDYLRSHPAIERVWHPRDETPERYEALRRPQGGYGGLLSFLPKNPAEAAPQLFDAWKVNKGPSLGTNFTLACPYLLLAHYPELPWCESLGLDRHLLRLSIGLEDSEVLIQRLEEALRRL
jgi:cystathionine gamma-synthase